MFRIFAIAAFLIMPLGTSVSEAQRFNGWQGPKPTTPCQCRHRGGKAMLGETICGMRSGRMVTLRCDKVLNNTNWTIVGEGCDVS